MEQAAERVTKLDQARVGLLIVVIAELCATGLSLLMRAAPELLAKSGADLSIWFWRGYAVIGFMLATVSIVGLLVLTLALRDQLLGWLALAFATLDAVFGLIAGVASFDTTWLFNVDLALFAVAGVLMLVAYASSARDVFPWLVFVAAGAGLLCVASAGWSLAQNLSHVVGEPRAPTSAAVKALRLLLSLVMHAGFVGVPLAAWIGLGRLGAPKPNAGW